MLPRNSKKISFQNELTDPQSENVYTFGVESRLVAEQTVITKGLHSTPCIPLPPDNWCPSFAPLSVPVESFFLDRFNKFDGKDTRESRVTKIVMIIGIEPRYVVGEMIVAQGIQ